MLSQSHDIFFYAEERTATHVKMHVRHIPIMLASKPGFAMSMTARSPPEKAMAFGGVAIGSMKAKEVEIVPGTSKKYGWMFMIPEIVFKMGSMIVHAETFEQNSVKNVMKKQTMTSTATGGQVCRNTS